MKRLATLLLLSNMAESRPQVDALSLDIKRLPFQRDYFFPEQKYWGYELLLQWDVSWNRFYLESNIPARTYNSRFRYVGWQYDMGYRLVPGVSLIWSHFSQHALDEYRYRYPISDSYGIRINFIK